MTDLDADLDEPMRAITVKQPWAWAIRYRFKPVENRSRNTNYRGPLAIHAGADWSTRGEQSPLVRRAWRDWAVAMPSDPASPGESGVVGQLRKENHLWIDRGAIIARANLVDCHPDQGCCRPWGESEYTEAGGRRRTAVHHLVLEQVQPLPDPIECRGWLGLWKVPPAVDLAIYAQLGTDAAARLHAQVERLHTAHV